LGLEEPEEEEESPPRVALAAKRPPRATTAASAPPEDADESDFFLEDFFLDDFDARGGLGGGRLGGRCGFTAALAGLRLQPGDLGAVEAGLGGALGLHLLVEGGRVRGGGWDVGEREGCRGVEEDGRGGDARDGDLLGLGVRGDNLARHLAGLMIRMRYWWDVGQSSAGRRVGMDGWIENPIRSWVGGWCTAVRGRGSRTPIG
jgi:hypothetical protein